MSKVMVLGDTHGNTEAAVAAVGRASSLGIDTIVQVGDFGLWDHLHDGIVFLDKLNFMLLSHNIKLIWVDGNHENFDRLDWYVGNNPKNSWGQVFIRSNILYSPRGFTWNYEGRRFMSVGGAVSIDKQWRKPHFSWWEQEQLTDAQLDKIIKKFEGSPGKVDVLFTHDCPTNAPFGHRLKDDPESLIHRQRMDKLGKVIKPTLWFHGHMHSKYDGYLFPAYESHTRVFGLECDGMAWNWGILDTDDLSFNWSPPFTPVSYTQQVNDSF